MYSKTSHQRTQSLPPEPHGGSFAGGLGRKIQLCRKMRGLTLSVLAQKLQVSVEEIERWERGEESPRPRVFPELVRLLGVQADWLLGVWHAGQQSPSQMQQCFSGVYARVSQAPRNPSRTVQGSIARAYPSAGGGRLGGE